MTIAPHRVDADTTICVSVSARPTSIGTRFHNYLYAELGLDFLYKAFRTTDIAGAIAGVRSLGIRGCSVSMPHKENVIALVDVLEPSAQAIGSVNTIVNNDGVLTASNTDYLAIDELIREQNIDLTRPVILHGSGGMAKAIAAVLHHQDAAHVTVHSRNTATGATLANRYGFVFADTLASPAEATLINATPMGMHGTTAGTLAFPLEHVHAARAVIDVVAFPADTPLVKAAESAGINVIGGDAIIARQAARQFVTYTGVTPTPDQIRRASRYSRKTVPES
ncbi:MAG: shikimate dehydrogenase [Microbacterium sp.]|nr:shikimate dehydrogenase [Microbacterium sp.]